MRMEETMSNLSLKDCLSKSVKILALAACTAIISTSFTSADDQGIQFSEETTDAFLQVLEQEAKAFSQLPVIGTEGGLELINGNPVDGRHLPQILKMTTDGTCTASIVGPSTVIIAAHCVDHRSWIKLVATSGSTFGFCEHHPDYPQDISADISMCLLQHKVRGIKFDHIDDDTVPPEGTNIVLTGFGCTQEGGPLDGQLRLGMSVASGIKQGNFLFTQSDLDAGQAVLCPGDSGGPAYTFQADFFSSRRLVGVNSRTTFGFGQSLLASTAEPANAAFLKAWTERWSQQVCGVNFESLTDCIF